MNYRIVKKAKRKLADGRQITPKEHALLIKAKKQARKTRIKMHSMLKMSLTAMYSAFEVATTQAAVGMDRLSKALKMIAIIENAADNTVKHIHDMNEELITLERSESHI